MVSGYLFKERVDSLMRCYASVSRRSAVLAFLWLRPCSRPVVFLYLLTVILKACVGGLVGAGSSDSETPVCCAPFLHKCLLNTKPSWFVASVAPSYGTNTLTGLVTCTGHPAPR